jgi:methylmalonyl-CoA mutase
MVRNTYIYPPEAVDADHGDIIATRRQNMPKFNSISISGYHMQEAGANQALELAFTLADGKEYVKTGHRQRAGRRRLRRAPELLLGHRHELLLEVAKMRAARLLWHRIMKEFGAKNPRA